MKQKIAQSSLDNLRVLTREEARLFQAKSIASKKRNRDLAKIARLVSESAVGADERKTLSMLCGLPEEKVTCSILIAAAVFRKAARGYLPAIRKWEEWLDRANREVTGQQNPDEKHR